MRYQIRSGMNRLLGTANTLEDARKKAIQDIDKEYDTSVVYIWNNSTLMGFVRKWDEIYTYGDSKGEKRINKNGSVRKNGNYGVYR